jgi:hypothetical protein
VSKYEYVCVCTCVCLCVCVFDTCDYIYICVWWQINLMSAVWRLKGSRESLLKYIVPTDGSDGGGISNSDEYHGSDDCCHDDSDDTDGDEDDGYCHEIGSDGDKVDNSSPTMCLYVQLCGLVVSKNR